MSNAAISVPGTIVTEPDTGQIRTHGRYKLVLSLPVDGGYSISTYPTTGPDRIDDLCFTTPDVDTANLIYRVIAEGGEKGVDPEGVRQALDEALRADLADMQRRRDRESAARANYINDLIDLIRPADEQARLDELVADVTAFLAGHTPARTLADTVPAGRKPQIPRSRTGVEHKPLTKAQERAIGTHIDGRVYPSPGVSRATLQGVASRGFGTLYYRGRTTRIVCLILNARGREAADMLAVAR